MQTITITNIHVRPIIGVYKHEHEAPQDIFVDVVVELLPRKAADDLATTLDYDRLVAVVEAVATEQLQLIETFGEQVAERCLAQESLMQSVTVTVRKPAALQNGLVAVATTRRREG